MAYVSEALQLAVKVARAHGFPAYKYSQLAGVSRAHFSGWMTGAVRVKRGHPRIVAVGKALGLTAAECFADTPPGEPVPPRVTRAPLKKAG